MRELCWKNNNAGDKKKNYAGNQAPPQKIALLSPAEGHNDHQT
jgi:hypothetical protein